MTITGGSEFVERSPCSDPILQDSDYLNVLHRPSDSRPRKGRTSRYRSGPWFESQHSLMRSVEQVQRLLNPLSDPDTRRDLERLHGVIAVQGALWLTNGPRQPTTRQRQVHLNRQDQATLAAAYLAGETVGNLASDYQLHRGTVSEILSRHGVNDRPHGPRRKPH